MSIKYLLLNYFSNNYFYNNGSGSGYDQRTISTINKLNNKDDINTICDELETWYNQNKQAIDSVLKMSGVASKSLDAFSISYKADYQQTLLNLLPIDLYLKLQTLGLLVLTPTAEAGGFLW